MSHDPKTALNNTTDDELNALRKQNDFLAEPDTLRDEMYDWEPATYGRPKNPLPGLAPNAPINFFQAFVVAEDIVIAITDRHGTNEPYVVWAGDPDQAAEAFLPTA